MIPRVIHYCWFGHNPKSPEAELFIQGWRRTQPNFDIVEWNENNFDVSCCRYVREAYDRRKFAFVSDYARGLALLRHGGVYLDTDVELVGRLESLLACEGFIGFEYGNSVATSTMGFRAGHPLMRRYLDQYLSRSFVRADGSIDTATNVTVLTRLAVESGLKLDGTAQVLADGVRCLPMQVLSPLDYVNFADHRDTSTVAVHHYQHTWGGPVSRLRKRLACIITRITGPAVIAWLRARIHRVGARGRREQP